MHEKVGIPSSFCTPDKSLMFCWFLVLNSLPSELRRLFVPPEQPAPPPASQSLREMETR
jgi:hypothetical protein